MWLNHRYAFRSGSPAAAEASDDIGITVSIDADRWGTADTGLVAIITGMAVADTIVTLEFIIRSNGRPCLLHWPRGLRS